MEMVEKNSGKNIMEKTKIMEKIIEKIESKKSEKNSGKNWDSEKK